MVPLLVTLLGADKFPPAWQSSKGVDIAPGAKLMTKHLRGLLPDGCPTIHGLFGLWSKQEHPFGDMPPEICP